LKFSGEYRLGEWKRGDSRKDAKHAKFGETKIFFALFAPWREKISCSGSVKDFQMKGFNAAFTQNG
jgi:hypothetical protein